MMRNEPERSFDKRQSRFDRVVDWLGAQGPLNLTIYMCSLVALFAYVVDAVG